MRKPRPSAFDPTYKESTAPKPETVDLGDVVAIQPKSPASQSGQPPTYPEMLSTDQDTVISRHHDTAEESKQPAAEPDMLEVVRKAVKVFGKEAATHRFTHEEKGQITEIIFKYSQQGIRTSENEITRIAVNYLIEDFKRRKPNSVLGKLLNLLNT